MFDGNAKGGDELVSYLFGFGCWMGEWGMVEMLAFIRGWRKKKKKMMMMIVISQLKF